MSGKVKTIISIIVSLVVIVAAIFIVTTVMGSSKDVTVYDLRLVQSAGNNTNVELVDKTVYLTTADNDYFEFNVLLKTSSAADINFKSSDESVAKAYKSGNKYICKYYRAGEATIAAHVGQSEEVKDEFKIVVKDNVMQSFDFADNGFVVNNSELNIYSDGQEYVFDYTAVGFNDSIVNYDSVSLKQNDNYLIKDVRLDTKNKKLILSVPDSQSLNFTEYLTFEVCHNTANGKTLVKEILVKVNVQKNVTLGYIAVVSNSPYFASEEYVYLGKDVDETYLTSSEKKVEKIILNNTHDAIYVRVYQINSNRSRINVTNKIGVNNVSYATANKDSTGGYIKITATASSVSDAEIFNNFGFIDIEFKGGDSPSINDLYTKKGNLYTYTYWDNRFERTDVICDADGNIIGFDNE